jgi:hypothetical protein
MESRFGRAFLGVRVHTDPWAAAVAEVLNARAFTLGSHVFFAAGQHAPGAPEGLRLLAHELVHVVQQGFGRPQCGLHIVGRPRDPSEEEADLVAERILTAQRLPTITTNAATMIRRTVKLFPNSVTIVPSPGDIAKVTPDVYVGPPALDKGFFFGPEVTCHLTNNFTPERNLIKQKAAFHYQGKVGTSLSTKDSLKGWDFGFLQFCQWGTAEWFYAGIGPLDGGIRVQAHFLLPTGPVLDSHEECRPWAWPPDWEVHGGVVMREGGDHPCLRLDTMLKHKDTHQYNYLQRVELNRDFWTVFSARDPSHKFQHLAYFHWALNYKFEFVYRDGKPVVRGKRGSPWKPDPFVRGVPPTTAIPGALLTDAWLANPTPPLANAVGPQTIKAALSAPPPVRVDEPRRFGAVPPDFF